MRITNIQKSALSKIFKEAGLKISDFIITNEVSEFKIEYRHDNFYFMVMKTEGYFHVEELSIYNIEGKAIASPLDNWNFVCKKFIIWCRDVFQEININDGWETYESQDFLNESFDSLNKPFNENEKEWVLQGINKLKDSIKALDIPQNEIKLLNLKLDSLSRQVNELSKFDWRALFVGTITTIILTFSIPPEVSGLLWNYIKQAFTERVLIK